jgi:hypothetical protein
MYLVLALKLGVTAGHALRSSDLLRLETSQARVSQSSLKIRESAAWMVHTASSWRSRRGEDRWVDVMDYIRLFYPNFVIFTVLGSSVILVF